MRSRISDWKKARREGYDATESFEMDLGSAWFALFPEERYPHDTDLDYEAAQWVRMQVQMHRLFDMCSLAYDWDPAGFEEGVSLVVLCHTR